MISRSFMRSHLRFRIWRHSGDFLWQSRHPERRKYATVFNAANELAVKKFLEEKIGFLDIYEIIAQSMERHKKIAHPDLDEILSVEQDTYQWIESRW